jgi:hypothetical protein
VPHASRSAEQQRVQANGDARMRTHGLPLNPDHGQNTQHIVPCAASGLVDFSRWFCSPFRNAQKSTDSMLVQARQCEHLSALLCHSSGHITQVIQALEAHQSCRMTGTLAKDDDNLPIRLRDELRHVNEERMQLKKIMSSIPELSNAFESALQCLQQSRNECEHLKQFNATQAAKHREAWQRWKKEHEQIRRSSLSKLNRLSCTLIHRRRVHVVMHVWSEHSRAKRADHEVFFSRRMQCCMRRPGIRCEYLWPQEQLPEKSAPEAGVDLFNLSESDNEHAVANARKPSDETVRNGGGCVQHLNKAVVNCQPLQLQEHELVRAHKTVKRLLRLIAQDGQASAPGILGVAFGADNVVMEIMPNSPAHDCGIIHIGDRLLQIDGREISEGFCGRLQGEVGTTVELSLETSLAEGHGDSGLDRGRVKCVKLTRASAMGVIMSNWSLIEGIESLAKYVEAHVAGTRGGAATSGVVGVRCGKSEEVQREKKGKKAVMGSAAASQDKERRLMQEREVRMTLENRLLKQQLAESQVRA